jgi:hypothetical protein
LRVNILTGVGISMLQAGTIQQTCRKHFRNSEKQSGKIALYYNKQ